MDKIIAKSISNIYNTAKQRISSNLQWAGQQAQRNIPQAVNSYVNKIPQVQSAKILKQNIQAIPRLMPQFQQNARANPIPMKAFEGLAEATTLGMRDIKYRPSQNLGEKLAYGTGYTLGMLNPASPLGLTAKAIGKLPAVSQGIANVTSKFAPTIAQGGLKALGARGIVNAAQGLPYTAAYSALRTAGGKGNISDAPTDLAFDFGVGALPLVGGLAVASSKPLKGKLKIRPGETFGAFQDRLEASAKPLLTKFNDFVSNQDYKKAEDVLEKMKKQDLYKDYIKPLTSVLEGSPTKQIDPLLSEAKKYKSAEEFVNVMRTKHRPPDIEGGSPLHDLTSNGSFPKDIYSDKATRLYGDYGMAGEKEAIRTIQQFKGKPDTEVTIYRAINPNETSAIKGGDWVTISKDYAKQHGESNLEKGFKIISKKVKAGDILNDGNSVLEWGYRPNGHTDLSQSQLTDIWNQANTPPVPKTNLLKQPRSEKVAIEMLKKGEITTQQYNEIAGREGFRAQPTLQEQQATKELEGLFGGNPNASMTNRLREEGSQLRQKGRAVAPYSGVDSNVSDGKIPIRTPDQVSRELLQPQTQPQAKVANMNTESLSKKLEVARYKRAQGAETSQINLPSMEDIVSAPGNNVKNKVNALDYLRTPDRVLQKIGLGKQAETIKQSYNNYLDELPKEINKVTQWYERVGKSKESSQRIFQYLDGKPVTLIGEEVPVANEIKQYLKKWADKLNLPDDKRIASYITHIFEKDFIQKEFDPDLAKIIQDKVPGSVYDPFLQERLGKQGYIEDAFRALDAYVKRATRKFHMDPALEKLSSASENLEIDSWNYVKQYADRINLRPTTLDNLVDNLVKSTPVGYKLGQRPVANVTRKLRQQVYRGTLGLNIGSAIRNLTQGVNTYAQLGEKYTATGYLKAIKAMMTGSQELENAGVLRNSFIEDRGISATKKLWEKIDKGLFTFFEMAEKINRGSAYYGAKSKALAQGMSEQDAVKVGLDLARKTQFTFGSVDTPVALQSDIIKFATQFQSFNIKQTEFLAEMFKSKQYSGLIRWLGANAVILLTLGKVMGWDWKDMIPFGGVLEGQTPIGGSPVFTLGRDIGALSTGGKDKYGQDMKPGQIATDLIPLIPGGVQVLNKTIPGVYDVNQGFATSGYGFEKLSDIATGNKRRIKYPIEKTPQNYVQAALLGGSNLPEARQYKESNSSVLGEKQSQSVRESSDKIGTYNKIMTKRATDKQIDKAREQAKVTNKTQTVGNVYVIPQPDGTTKTVDMAKQIPKPDLSGSLDMDKMEVTKFKSAITRQAGDIQDLYKAGQIDLQTAITKIADLKSQTAQLPTFTVKKPKKIASIKVKKTPSIKIKRPKRLKYKKPKKLKIKGIKPMKWKTVKLKRP